MYIHLTFGTKGRKAFINKNIEAELHSYMASIFKNKESPALKINFVLDHTHILFQLSKNYALAKVVEDIKKNSSKWIKTKGIIEFA